MENELPNIDDLPPEPPVAAERAPKRGFNLPLGLTLLALLIWFGFHTAQLFMERKNLGMVKSNFETAMQESQKMQGQLQTLITKTAELASQGNPGAKVAVEELEKRGIPIKGVVAQPSK